MSKVSLERLIESHRVLNWVKRLVDGLAWIGGLFVTYSWLVFCLRRFPLTWPWGDAMRTPGLRLEPPPFVLQTALSDFYVECQLCAFLEKPETRMRTLSLLHAHIQDVFNEHGVQITSPHYEADPLAPVWVPKEKWFEAPAQKSGESA